MPFQKTHTQRVWNLLQEYQGAQNGISAQALARRVPCSDRQVRDAISELRNEGVAVCGHPSSGYYLANDRQDIDRTCDFLRKRALHSLRLEAAMRQTPLGDLMAEIRHEL